MSTVDARHRAGAARHQRGRLHAGCARDLQIRHRLRRFTSITAACLTSRKRGISDRRLSATSSPAQALTFDVIAGIETGGIPHSAALAYALHASVGFCAQAAERTRHEAPCRRRRGRRQARPADRRPDHHRRQQPVRRRSAARRRRAGRRLPGDLQLWLSAGRRRLRARRTCR